MGCVVDSQAVIRCNRACRLQEFLVGSLKRALTGHCYQLDEPSRLLRRLPANDRNVRDLVERQIERGERARLILDCPQDRLRGDVLRIIGVKRCQPYTGIEQKCAQRAWRCSRT